MNQVNIAVGEARACSKQMAWHMHSDCFDENKIASFIQAVVSIYCSLELKVKYNDLELLN